MQYVSPMGEGGSMMEGRGVARLGPGCFYLADLQDGAGMGSQGLAPDTPIKPYTSGVQFLHIWEAEISSS